MAETFLEQQLKRIREMSERMSEARSQVLENSARIAVELESMHSTPLHEVRDLRTHSSITIKSSESANDSALRRRRRRTPR